MYHDTSSENFFITLISCLAAGFLVSLIINSCRHSIEPTYVDVCNPYVFVGTFKDGEVVQVVCRAPDGYWVRKMDGDTSPLPTVPPVVAPAK